MCTPLFRQDGTVCCKSPSILQSVYHRPTQVWYTIFITGFAGPFCLRKKGTILDRKTITAEQLRYLTLLAREYPTIDAASASIINLEAVLKLPKGTEHFMSDLHGEHEAFTHILNNASGVIREKVDLVLGDSVPAQERANLSTLIYYPAQKLEELREEDLLNERWYRTTLYRLIDVCRQVASKNTRRFVRASLPKNFETITDELLHAHFEDHSKDRYYAQIVGAVIRVGQADDFICALCELIKKLAVYKLHIVGDLFDRGPRPDIILDKLMAHHSVDFQWGNHDVLWMGAAAGSDACIAAAVNITLGFGNTELLEEGYGISLRPLAELADELYGQEECKSFWPITQPGTMDRQTACKIARMHKVIALLTFKLEAVVIRRNPDFGMQDRLLLPAIDLLSGQVTIEGKTYPLLDTHLPTLNPDCPEALTKQEQEVLNQLRRGFMQSEKLARQVRFLYAKGSVYRVENGNLMFHGAIPMEPDGSFTTMTFEAEQYAGRQLMDYCEQRAREGYFAPLYTAERLRGQDFLWYLWCGPKSPIYGRSKMATFEHLLVGVPEVCIEKKDPYYDHTDSAAVFGQILTQFGLDPQSSHVINGHVPVLAKKGEQPIKAGGRLIVIDGGFCRAYHEKTGIAGYTLVYSSRGLSLRSHEPFESTQKAIRENRDILSTVSIFETSAERILIEDTDEGARYQARIRDLEALLDAYRAGLIQERAGD